MVGAALHLILALLWVPVISQNIFDLADSAWTIGNGVNVSGVPGRLPSQAHIDLYAAKVIGDPLYGDNDYNQLWVQRSNWTYVSSPIHGLYVMHDICVANGATEPWTGTKTTGRKRIWFSMGSTHSHTLSSAAQGWVTRTTSFASSTSTSQTSWPHATRATLL